MDETDIVVGKDEVKIGNSTISDSNVLPVATEEDAGKVPTVQDDGSYALANAGCGSSPLVVTFSGTTADGNAACDKTWAEISAAITAGKEIKMQYQIGITCYSLVFSKDGDVNIKGTYTYISNPSNPNNGYYYAIYCFVNIANNVYLVAKIVPIWERRPLPRSSREAPMGRPFSEKAVCVRP